MYVAYKGHSVVLFAPVAALLAVLLTDPTLVAPMYLGVFMDKMVNFVKLYFPVFMLGAVFGKVIELSGYSKSIVSSVVGAIGHERAMLAIVVVCAILTYGGVSLFVVVFAVYPFAAELFRQTHIPKRLIPGTIALGAFTFTMDSLPGTPQIQNIIPTSFFQTSTWAAPWLGVVGAIFIFIVGMLYLNWQRRRAEATGEDYGINLANEPEPFSHEKLPNPILAITPLFLVGILNYVFTQLVPVLYGTKYELTMTGIGAKPVPFEVPKVAAIWAVEAALLMGILFVVITAWGPIREKFAEGAKSAVAGSLLAAMNTASEYGFGGVIAALPGFLVVADALRAIPNPLINEAVTVTALAGITGSASGGMSIALATMATHFIEVANAAGIPLEVLHRVASMASGGMDTLPHNGAVITLLAVTGLTHMQSYKDIFAITVIKTSAVFVVIAFYYLTGIY
ncbi:putative D-beta-hydroxybutyrate permease [Candidatus Competibacter denitrificans Run_A_D11]|uniref:D-beta-hydroxybutyrate permease n=2 Tax=Candidatus Competibacter TaxID=221279 RepID=W6M7G8_9GAMM|nr:putative D-beta-hydroxybutyrate permease [Candidatus Competibacter denitrificans Run_A_D11]